MRTMGRAVQLWLKYARLQSRVTSISFRQSFMASLLNDPSQLGMDLLIALSLLKK